MRVICEQICEHELPSGATRRYPLGWSGHVADEVGAAWVTAGKARQLDEAPAPVEFTSEEASVLKAAAAEALAAVSPGAIIEPTVEPVVETDEVDLNAMTANELRAVAKQVGIAGTKAMTKAELIAALEARRA